MQEHGNLSLYQYVSYTSSAQESSNLSAVISQVYINALLLTRDFLHIARSLHWIFCLINMIINTWFCLHYLNGRSLQCQSQYRYSLYPFCSLCKRQAAFFVCYINNFNRKERKTDEETSHHSCCSVSDNGNQLVLHSYRRVKGNYKRIKRMMCMIFFNK